MTDKITFIIPSVKRVTLFRTIDSLIKQKNPNWKCIVIYDGLDGPSFSDDRIKTIKIPKTGRVSPYHDTPDHGISGLVRNSGLVKVETKWIGFIDDDDTINTNYVYDLFEKYSEYDLVIWRMKFQDGSVLPPVGDDTLAYGKVGISFCYKNKFKNLYFESSSDSEDYDMIMNITKLTNNFIVAPEIYYNVRH